MSRDAGDVTRLLLAWSEGDPQALERLTPLVYEELRRIARHHLEREDPRHTLQPTAVVHEVFLRLLDRRRVQWENRVQFFAFAAELVRRVLVDHWRNRNAEKRGEGVRPVSLEEVGEVAAPWDTDLVELDDALKSLSRLDERQGRVVELRFFGGLTHGEIGEVLGVSKRTVKREWMTARLWLHRTIRLTLPSHDFPP